MISEMVRLERVRKSYQSVVALAEIDLSVHAGEFLTLLGPSGSGKTTILNLIAGTIEPTGGRVWVGGKDVTDVPSNRRGLGMVFQNYALFPHMTIFENVAFPLRVRNIGSEEIKRRVNETLDLVQLPQVAKRKPRELSGGQQQRIAIARSLVYNPHLILMDEPLGALDKKLRDQMQLEIKRLHKELGLTVLYVTHDQEEALVMSDRVCLMNAGRIEQLGTPDDLYFRPASVFAADFLGESNILNAQAIADEEGMAVRTAGGGLTIRDLQPAPPAGPLRVMIRPESIAPLAPGEMAPCSATGTVDDVVFVGGVTTLRVRVAPDVVLSVKRLTSTGQTRLRPGNPIAIGFSPGDVVVLPARAGQPGPDG